MIILYDYNLNFELPFMLVIKLLLLQKLKSSTLEDQKRFKGNLQGIECENNSIASEVTSVNPCLYQKNTSSCMSVNPNNITQTKPNCTGCESNTNETQQNHTSDNTITPRYHKTGTGVTGDDLNVINVSINEHEPKLNESMNKLKIEDISTKSKSNDIRFGIPNGNTNTIESQGVKTVNKLHATVNIQESIFIVNNMENTITAPMSGLTTNAEGIPLKTIKKEFFEFNSSITPGSSVEPEGSSESDILPVEAQDSESFVEPEGSSESDILSDEAQDSESSVEPEISSESDILSDEAEVSESLVEPEGSSESDILSVEVEDSESSATSNYSDTESPLASKVSDHKPSGVDIKNEIKTTENKKSVLGENSALENQDMVTKESENLKINRNKPTPKDTMPKYTKSATKIGFMKLNLGAIPKLINNLKSNQTNATKIESNEGSGIKDTQSISNTGSEFNGNEGILSGMPNSNIKHKTPFEKNDHGSGCLKVGSNGALKVKKPKRTDLNDTSAKVLKPSKKGKNKKSAHKQHDVNHTSSNKDEFNFFDDIPDVLTTNGRAAREGNKKKKNAPIEYGALVVTLKPLDKRNKYNPNGRKDQEFVVANPNGNNTRQQYLNTTRQQQGTPI